MRTFGLGVVCVAITAGAAWAQDGVRFLKIPDPEEKVAAWPRDASGRSILGAAKLDCFVKAEGVLDGCTVAEENPPGHGIGEAALKLAPKYHVQITDNTLQQPDGRMRIALNLNYDTPPTEVKGIRQEQIKAGYPKEAGDKDGSALLQCQSDLTKGLKNCEIISEKPAGLGFGTAALAMVGSIVIKPALALGKPVSTDIQFSVDFTKSIVTNPDWVRKPNVDELRAVYPTKARGRDGGAVIKCVIGVRGVLKDCLVLSERPLDAGFGGAALQLAPSMLMKPGTKDGHPVEGTVSIPVAFVGFGNMNFSEKVQVFQDPPWLTVPTIEDVQAAFPKEAIGHVQVGTVALQCDASKAGHLRNCTLLNETPDGFGFNYSALKLANKFVIDPAWMATRPTDVSVNFRLQVAAADSPVWKERPLGKVLWNSMIDVRQAQALYPPEATKAGITSGSAVVSCSVAASGSLTGCSTVSESAAGVGFGQAATVIAQSFVMNPWTNEGLPVEGAKVTLPVKLVYAADPAPTPATKP